MTAAHPISGGLDKLRIAIVHEWFVDYSGSERVAEQILTLVPHADLFAVVEFLPEPLKAFIRHKPVKTTFIQGLPFAAKKYRAYLPLMPFAIEQHDLSSYDLIISSSHAVAKGVLTGPDQVHVSYVHSPMRYAWDMQHQYLKHAGLDGKLKGWIARWMLHRIRIWDVRTSNGVDRFVANSEFIARRVWKTYRREATVIYPPVAVEDFPLRVDKEDFYLAASRFVPYKRMDIIVDAFSAMPNKHLVVIGTGQELARVRSRAGANVHFLGYQETSVLRDYMQRAKAFVFAAEEDFGILPVEAQACGTPVIAYGQGGALESIEGLDAEEPTGLFFDEQSPQSLIMAVKDFEAHHSRFSPEACRRSAERFASARFRAEFEALLHEEIAKAASNRHRGSIRV